MAENIQAPKDKIYFFGKNLKFLRMEKSLNRQELSDKSKVSTKTLERWEKGVVRTKPHDNELEKVANVLGVKVFDFIYTDLENQKEKLKEDEKLWEAQGLLKTSYLSSIKTRLDYELVEQEYGVSKEQLYNLAPLLFTVLAEQSLKWRADRLKLIDQKIEEIRAINSQISRAVANDCDICVENLVEYESISKKDVFGNLRTNDYPFYNPFFEYISEISDRKNVKIWEDFMSPCPDSVSNDAAMGDEIPKYYIIPQALSKIFAGVDFNKFFDENDNFDYTVFGKLVDIPQLKQKYFDAEKLKWEMLKIVNAPDFQKKMDDILKEIEIE